MATLEPLYRLDVVMDQKKPSWSWLQDMAALYRAAIINSNGKFKIICERDDLPVRQVFHSGNIIRERTEVRVGGDPMQINQISAQFSNRAIDYERDLLIIQDSQSVLIDNDPIKPFDLDLTGVTRQSEANRRLSVEMRRRNEIKTEMTFFTNVQGVVVEPGDICVAGVIMTDYEMGWGGRALDGSTTSLLADKQVVLASGTVYDLWVRHSASDTPELRTLLGSASVANLIPTTPFNYAVRADDVWAVGVQSEDLVRLLVKKVSHGEDGVTQIVGEQFVNVGFLLDCPSSAGSFVDYYDMPTMPWSITVAQTNCEVCFQLHFTAPGCVGGSLIGAVPSTPYMNNAFCIIFPTTTNLPLPVSSISDQGVTAENTITFITGPNSGLSRRILEYPLYISASQSWVMMVSPLPNLCTSGDQYYVTFDQGSNFAGFRGQWWTSTQNQLNSNSQNLLPTISGNSGCFDLANTADSLYLKITTVSSIGALGYGGPIFGLQLPGCFAHDERIGFSTASITTQSVSNLLAMFLPGSELGIDAAFQIKASGLLNDVCSANETTRVSFGLTYAGTTIIDSLVILMRDPGTSTSVGSNAPFVLTADLRVLTVPVTHIRAALKYEGYRYGGTLVATEMLSGLVNSIDFTRVQSLTFTADVEHLDSGSAVHSHGCHAIALDHGEFEIIDTVDA